VNNTRWASSAMRSAARAASSVRSRSFHGDNAIKRAPCIAAARRNEACSPWGRKEMTYHPGGSVKAMGR
jgi:hypothetical protein